MFGDVWAWAGKLRQRETNIGFDPRQIPVAMRDLCEDTVAQIGDGSNLAYVTDELAVRFHHRLVLIHPFPKGTADTHAWPPTCSSPTCAPNRSPGKGPNSSRSPTFEPII